MLGNTGKVKIEIYVDEKDGTVRVRKLAGEMESAGKKGEQSFRKTGKSLGEMNTKLVNSEKLMAKLRTAVFALAGAYGIHKLSSAMLDAIGAASDLQEVTSKFETVFGNQLDLAEAWSETLVQGYAMSTREAKQHLAAMQDLLVPMGMEAEAASRLSFEIVKLSADLGSFNNLQTSQVMGDIQSALVGNYETMKKYGVVLNASTVQERALALGLADTKDQLTAAHKAQAAYQMIVQGSSAAIGDMARTSDGYANKLKNLESRIENLKAKIGDDLLPVAGEIVTEITKWVEANDELLAQDVKTYVDDIYNSLKGVKELYDAMPDGVVGAAGYGVVGWVLFGNRKAGLITASLKLLNDELERFYGLGLTSLPKDYAGLNENINNIMEALTGLRDIDTGELINPGSDGQVFTGQIDQVQRYKSSIEQTAASFVDYIRSTGDSTAKNEENSRSILEQARALTELKAGLAAYKQGAGGGSGIDTQAFLSQADMKNSQDSLRAQAELIDKINRLNIKNWEGDYETDFANEQDAVRRQNDAVNQIQGIWDGLFLTESEQLVKWYDEQKLVIDANILDHNKRAQALGLLSESYYEKEKELADHTFGDDMKNAMSGWASQWSSTLNEMLWGADASFGKIAESFAKMVTQMALQRMTVEPLFDGLSSVLGNLDFSWLTGGGFTPNFDNPVQFMADGGAITEPVYGVGASGRRYKFGENYKREWVVPESGGSMPVQAQSAPQINVNIHEAEGTSARVEQDGQGNLDIIIEQVESSMTRRMQRGTGMASFLDGRYNKRSGF